MIEKHQATTEQPCGEYGKFLFLFYLHKIQCFIAYIILRNIL